MPDYTVIQDQKVRVTYAPGRDIPDSAGHGEQGIAALYVRAAKQERSPYTGQVPVAISSVQMRIIRRNYVDLSWDDDTMFMENLTFPHNISYNSDGAETFSTEINSGDDGGEQRIAHWEQPLMEYNIAYGVRTMDQLHDLKRFYRSVQGPRHGFRFRDPVDYTSSYATGEEARSPDPVTAFDQVIGTGDGLTFEFQLVKAYDYENAPAERKITKPVPGTVRIASNGIEYPSDRFTVDTTTGMVTLDRRVEATVGGSVTMTRVTTTERTIEWTDASSLTIEVGEYVFISGFANGDNAVPEVEAWEVVQVDNAGKLIRMVVPSGGNTTLGQNETVAGSVNITTVLTPLTGWSVTAGYEFDVPVRFDTDRLPIRLEHYGIGSGQQITLREIRRDDQ